jgi:glycine/D-amino acid oxidase-like deaminating enzyme
VTKAELRDEIGSDRYHGGLIFEKSAGMHVGRYVRGLAKAAQARGAQILEHAPVLGLRRESGGTYVVQTPRGEIRASQVLLASGISQTTTRAPFLASANAAAEPVIPPPTTTTSQRSGCGSSELPTNGSDVSSQ